MPHMTLLDPSWQPSTCLRGIWVIPIRSPHSLRLDPSGFQRKNCNSLVTTNDDTDENLYSVWFQSCCLHSHSHTLTITCTCCYDEIKGTQDLKIYSHADSLILSPCLYPFPHFPHFSALFL